MFEPSTRFALRHLSLPIRLVLAAFLVSVGIGFFSALVQIHVQQASPGQTLPGPEELKNNFSGQSGVSTLERLIVTPESKPFNSSGSMRRALTTKSIGWAEAVDDRAGDIDNLPEEEQNRRRRAAEVELRKERDGEAQILVHWIRSGLDRKSYEADAYALPDELSKQPITDKYVQKHPGQKSTIRIQTLITNRCARCHREGGSSEAADAPLDSYRHIAVVARPEPRGFGLSLRKLAQSTHVHLLGFSMLYGLTGLLFAWTTYPGWLRFVLAPLPLVVQVIEISFWWLARLPDESGPKFAEAIRICGGIVAASLGLQIVLTLFNLFNKAGKTVLVLLFAAALAGGYYAKEHHLDRYLQMEKDTATIGE